MRHWPNGTLEVITSGITPGVDLSASQLNALHVNAGEYLLRYESTNDVGIAYYTANSFRRMCNNL